jgi:hypothetical protein
MEMKGGYTSYIKKRREPEIEVTREIETMKRFSHACVRALFFHSRAKIDRETNPAHARLMIGATNQRIAGPAAHGKHD